MCLLSPTISTPPAQTPIEVHFRGAAADLHLSHDREVLIEGPAGTGKSYACLAKCFAVCESTPRARVLIARATRASMTQSILVTLERDILERCRPRHFSLRESDASKATRRAYQFRNGSELVLGGLDNTERIMSTEFDLIYVAEATEISEEDWERLLTRLRSNRLPYQQAIADCNPGPPSHWLNRRAMQGKMRRLLSRHADNPSLTPEYLATLANLSGHRRARLFEGRWVAGEGAVFPEFSTDRHVLQPFTIPADWPHFVACDPGFDHPTAIVWVAVSPNGTLYVVDEIHRGGLPASEHAKAIHGKNTGRTVAGYYGDPRHMFSKTAQSPETLAQQYGKHGFRFRPWPMLAGAGKEAAVESVRRLLREDRLFVFANCGAVISEFQSWSYRRVRGDELPAGDDQFEDRNNDAMDAIIGLVAARPAVGTTPVTACDGIVRVDPLAPLMFNDEDQSQLERY